MGRIAVKNTCRSRARVAFFLLLVVLVAACGAENIDADAVDRFCYPESKRDSRLSCECNNVSAAPWVMRALRIDCSYKEYRTADLSEMLPLYIDTLDLSWNALDQAPVFSSDSLHQLNLMHNNISRLSGNKFAKLSSLRELYLGWNSISQVEAQTFAGLPHLQVLDLAHNNLHSVPAQLFAPLLVLTSLDLSWNRKLNETTQLRSGDLYTDLGINWKLTTLRLDACNLNELRLPSGAPLKELSLRRNLFQRVPGQLPQTMLHFDISDNLLEQLLPEDTANLTQVRQLFVEDMSLLQGMAAHALVPLEQLESISFQNSRRLSHFDADAFGPLPKVPSLRTMSFRGTLLRSFNSSLSPVFAKLTELDLNGVPLHCDCELVWLKKLWIETGGRCLKPSRIRGMLLSSARHDAFSCDTWPRWAYGLVVLTLIALSAAGIYLIVMGLRPHQGVTMRRKVGAGSPYARVTIEPNHQENLS
ncbi:leucine-rich repeat neuronal protein 2-like [Drosophila miranda]|uniref:leucine-rich repeat neuronal protein 2-like n=1 Tax=Drosophila miranda TaxID=7229 RepID=UPI00143F197E|nr:leucine-rich repeat neuronal protein 2-like [Drosophila miranda]